MPRYFVRCAYDGTAYHGWQRQENAISVQEVMENAIAKVLHQSVMDITGAGRTDSGVHASEYYFHFDTAQQIPDIDKLLYSLNALLPKDIAVYAMRQVRLEAHARFSAEMREYTYYFIRQKNPFREKYAARIKSFPDVDLLNAAAAKLIGSHDFGAFAKKGSDTATTLCRVSHAAFTADSETLQFCIRSDRFLRNMVRAVTGMLMAVGKGRCSEEEINLLLNNPATTHAAFSVPAKGLFLSGIQYPESIWS